MSIIQSLKTYVADFSELESGDPIWVNHLGKEPTEHSLIPLDGSSILAEYVNGSTLNEYPFAFQSVESTEDDSGRIATIGFFEELKDWFRSQTIAGDLPDLDEGKTSRKIEALGWGFLFEQGESGTGVYQIQGLLTYHQSG